MQVLDDFLQFIELNSQPNGRSAYSHGATHFFLSKYTSIRMPSRGAKNYDKKMKSSLVGEFNCCRGAWVRRISLELNKAR